MPIERRRQDPPGNTEGILQPQNRVGEIRVVLVHRDNWLGACPLANCQVSGDSRQCGRDHTQFAAPRRIRFHQRTYDHDRRGQSSPNWSPRARAAVPRPITASDRIGRLLTDPAPRTREQNPHNRPGKTAGGVPPNCLHHKWGLGRHRDDDKGCGSRAGLANQPSNQQRQDDDPGSHRSNTICQRSQPQIMSDQLPRDP